jgi:hypothetical protein
MTTPKFFPPVAFSICLLMANPGAAQTAAPAPGTPESTTPAAPATTAPGASAGPAANGAAAPGARPRGAAGGRGAGAAPQPWARPADGPAIITEDFESGAMDSKTWTISATGSATVTVEQDFVAHGKNALHVHYPAGARNAIAFIGLNVPDALRDHFYGRAYVYMKTIPSGHCVLMTAGSKGYPTSTFLEIGMRQNQFQPSFQQNGPNVTRYEDHPLQGTPPAGRWFCLEWEFNDKPDRIVMWIDGKLAVNQTFKGPAPENSKTGLTGGFFQYDVGFRSWSAPTKDVDVYYDDIAISDKPIGQLTPVTEPVAK